MDLSGMVEALNSLSSGFFALVGTLIGAVFGTIATLVVQSGETRRLKRTLQLEKKDRVYDGAIDFVALPSGVAMLCVEQNHPRDSEDRDRIDSQISEHLSGGRTSAREELSYVTRDAPRIGAKLKVFAPAPVVQSFDSFCVGVLDVVRSENLGLQEAIARIRDLAGAFYRVVGKDIDFLVK